MTRELVTRITKESFADSRPIVIGTGGLSRLFEDADVFDAIKPDLVLTGLLHALRLNAWGDAICC
jgi:type III pantothenate kinase